MSFVIQSLYCLALCLSLSTAFPLQHQRRAVISHDAVASFPETVPAGTIGEVYLKYKPYLHVLNGCVPFPAVDANGDVSGGLKTTGSSNGECSKSLGQVYARSSWQGDSFAIMYAWFFPKDSPSSGLGHRYDWENIVVWLSSDDPATASLLGVSASQHSGYETTRSPSVSGTGGPRIRYQSQWPVNHALFFTETVGGQQPLVAWEVLGSAAREALQSFDFGDANCSFKDGNFESNLAKAVLQ